MEKNPETTPDKSDKSSESSSGSSKDSKSSIRVPLGSISGGEKAPSAPLSSQPEAPRRASLSELLVREQQGVHESIKAADFKKEDDKVRGKDKDDKKSDSKTAKPVDKLDFEPLKAEPADRKSPEAKAHAKEEAAAKAAAEKTADEAETEDVETTTAVEAIKTDQPQEGELFVRERPVEVAAEAPAETAAEADNEQPQSAPAVPPPFTMPIPASSAAHYEQPASQPVAAEATPALPAEAAAETVTPPSQPEFAPGQPDATPAQPTQPNRAEAGAGGPPIVPPTETTFASPNPEDDPVQPENTSAVPAQPEFAPMSPYEHEQNQAFMNPSISGGAAGEGGYNYPPGTLTAAEQVAQDSAQADREAAAHSRGVAKGAAAGGFFGYLFGRRRGRIKAEKAAEQQLQQRDSEIQGLKAADEAAQQRSSVLNSTVERLGAQVQGFEERLKTRQGERLKPETIAERSVRLRAAAGNQPAAAGSGHEFAALASMPAAELFRPDGTRPAAAEQQPKPAEAAPAPEDQPITEDTYKAPEGRRYETSAWHRYEVDAATGKLVNDPEQVYGEEFKKEQRQELAKGMPLEPSAAKHLGHAVVSGGAAGIRDPQDENREVQGIGMAATEAVSPELQAAQKHTPIPVQPAKNSASEMAKQVVGYAKQPIIWVAAAVIVILLFMFGLLR